MTSSAQPPSNPSASPPEETPLSTFMRAARSEISSIHHRLDLVAQSILSTDSTDPPAAAADALELLRGVQGTVDDMVGSMAAMSEALRRMEAWQTAG